ncbi:hypothetical protein ASPWEDRAFT_47362 [Aspergillus wentii DTO 134E9]|uniref:AGC-kinase C-terminal domain-containing protein n=1 Tax=Aspergillus wentii DTO 134E9 TaxID=1073089 RepID=A0A1L9S079_ASPWE|nr:uncharacterized protein ASPWEDRAFT_47362 [Aspergillus wentii DTO 134E9]KAI9932976.1 hypothetical protein MW887_009230 [Aspergillus wentii]OJJ40563.1 hypothetical protein ASPWEDRAFT_47362 [Aspergillus wentii DTO 134E9]
MAPSTVFSYWRRDHRRSSASPVSSSVQQPTSKGGVADHPPQLPTIQNTPEIRTSTSDGSPAQPDGANNPQIPNENSPDLDALKLNVVVSTSNAPSSSSTTLAVPSSSSEKQPRPHSSPEERERDPTLTSQSNNSQWSFTTPRPDGADGESSKPNSPFRLSFGKGPSKSHSQSAESNKRSSSSGVTSSGHFRFKTSPDDSPADKSPAPQKEYKVDGTGARRSADRDVSAEPGHHKSGKAMLHLLNPMSLLARRRSSQIAGSRTEDMKIGARNLVPAIPDDYDPRIRGNIVHDFSAPRPRRNLSATPVILQDAASQNNAHESSPRTSGSQAHGNDLQSPVNEQKKKHGQYSPVFKEHFEDDQKVLQVENKAYLQSPLLMNSSNTDNENSLPVFARKLPSKLPDQDEKSDEQAVLDPEPVPEPSGNKSPANQPEQDAMENVSQQRSGLPRHLKSNASRFSFDMNCVESSVQEKLLEEKHKEKEAARRAKQLENGEFSDADDDFDNDILDDIDGLEEEIPGVNVDADEDEFSGFSGPGNLINKSWLAPGLSPIIPSPVSPVPPNLAAEPVPQGQSLGLGVNQNPSLQESHPSYEDKATNDVQPQSQQMNNTEFSTAMPQPSGVMNPGVPQTAVDDDDLYFDDGEFGDLTAEAGGETFDESIFDDPNSHLYERKKPAEPIAPIEAIEEESELSDTSSEKAECSTYLNKPQGLKHVPSMASEYTRAPLGPAQSEGGILSEHNLEALHNALTKAATQAATKGTVERNPSASERSMGQESASQTAQTADSHSGLVSDDSRLSQPMDALALEETYEDFNYDDDYADLYDDPIIAAANAEALENDDEGFYGEEFGFYAQTLGTCGSELTNGGYFGPRGVEGITRSFSSSRGKFREPSLTPITERSEWSTRNSVISLTTHGAPSNQPLSSPGLAQLVDMGTLDDEMSLSALMKLRRGAWGGSNGSLRSSSGSPPPHPHSSSNRASFTALSDASPTVQSIPADYMGTGATTSPI